MQSAYSGNVLTYLPNLSVHTTPLLAQTSAFKMLLISFRFFTQHFVRVLQGSLQLNDMFTSKRAKMCTDMAA